MEVPKALGTRLLRLLLTTWRGDSASEWAAAASLLTGSNDKEDTGVFVKGSFIKSVVCPFFLRVSSRGRWRRSELPNITK